MIEIVPAIDICKGKCVRLKQGDYDACTIYSSDPLEVAKRFESVGVKRLHLVDLDGAKAGGVVNIEVLRQISKETNLEIDFSGGVKREYDLISVLDAGADYVGIGSLAIQKPQIVKSWIKYYGTERIILSADVWGDQIAIMGWREQTDMTLVDFIELYNGYLTQLICTDISRDGMLEGPSYNLYKRVKEKYPNLKIIASGGVSNMGDVEQLQQIGVEGVIIGKAIYENKITLKEIELWIKQ